MQEAGSPAPRKVPPGPKHEPTVRPPVPPFRQGPDRGWPGRRQQLPSKHRRNQKSC